MKLTHPRRILAATALTTSVFASLLVPGGATAAPAASDVPDLDGLRVLLTNDDSARGLDTRFGTDGKGLYELRKALCGAGADVLVVAPWSQQSGAAARLTTPGFAPVPLTVQAMSPPTAYAADCSDESAGGAVFGVCQSGGPCSSSTPSASPGDAANIALSRFAANYWDDGPDVVVSGTNFGQNVGSTLNHSGTVGAIVTAHEHGVPALAFSAEVPRNLAQIPLTPFAETASFATDLLGDLKRGRDLESGLLLNVNYPFVGPDEKLGRVVRTVAGTSNDVGYTYSGDVDADGGTYQLVPGTPPEETRRNADTAALADNDIPVTRLDADWSASRGGLLASLLQ